MAPKTLVGTQSGAGSKACQKRAQVHRRTEQDIIQRAIDDHFGTFSNVEVDAILRGTPPLTLRQRLTKERAESDVKHFRFAPSLIAELRQLYASENSVESRLKVRDEEQEVDPGLIAAMTALQHKNKAVQSKDPLYAWLETSKRLNQKSLMGILRHVNTLNLHWPASRSHALRILTLLTDKQWHVKHKDDFAVLAGRWDELLALSFAAARKQGLDVEKWWTANSTACEVLPSHLSFQKIMSETVAWANVLDELQYVTDHTLLGKRMFAQIADTIGVEAFSASLIAEVDKCESKKLAADAFKVYQVLG
eukprot:6482235-Amphidinium_carterae.2